MEQPEIKDVIEQNQEGLEQYFKFYSSLGKQEIGLDLEFTMSRIHYLEFIKFGHAAKIIPVLMTAEDLVQTFRHIARQQQSSYSGNSSTKEETMNFKSGFSPMA